MPSKKGQLPRGLVQGRNHVPYSYIIARSGRKGKGMIQEILKIGKENALSPEYLANKLHLGTVRALQKQVEKERKQGAVILSSSVPPGGYYLPGSRQEVMEFIRTLENRADGTLEALESAKRYLGKFEE